MSKLTYYPIELHSHTYHSDGGFSPKELLQNARDFGYKGIFLTDHNTNSGLDEIYENKFDKKILKAFHGIEWTTFYGHLLILGSKDAGNYTKARLDNIEECINEIKSSNLNIVIGIAHPFDIGNPLCTGCHFEYLVNDYSKFNYIELVNSENAHASKSTLKAYKRWIELLEEGYRLAALAGRDWHRPSNPKESVAISMIGIDGNLSEENTLKAIKRLHTYISYGPILHLNLDNIELGDKVYSKEIKASVRITDSTFKNKDELKIVPHKFVVYNNEKLILEKDINYDSNIDFEINNFDLGYIRFEVLGDMKDMDNQRLIITSPIFIKEK